MKLFTKYNRVNVAATIITFILGGVAFYFLLSYILNRQLDDTLRSEQQEITEYVNTYGKLPVFQNTRHQWMQATPANREMHRPHVKSYTAYNKHEDENEWIRQLSFTIKAGDIIYTVEVNRSQTETEDLLKLIIILTLGMIGLILLFNYLINRRLVTRLWKPFYNTIEGIKSYYVASEKPIELPAENIEELNLLNISLNEMTARIYREYKALKAFTENASHEMQTPLAVIRSKIDLLLQSGSLKETELKNLLQIEDASAKLGKLHQSLILLTKLENRQFASKEALDIQKIVDDKIAGLQELAQTKNITLTAETQPAIIFLHHHLGEILITNLLNNALRYTPAGGKITGYLDSECFILRNTAANGALDKSKVFNRFYKASDGFEGTGLGLAIIKEISNMAGYEVEYNFFAGEHVFSIYFVKQ